ncbi:MAG: hypothetical protein HYY93_16075 [Planctomycetes bacterium]|nr:hypothetical protein [Planctomycetota bacterium]
MKIKVLIDNCLSPRLAQALRILEEESCEVRHLLEEFSKDPGDIVWIRDLARRGGWFVISLDRIHKPPAQREILRQTGLNIFLLAKGYMSISPREQASRLLHLWDAILEAARTAKPGECFRIPISGARIEKFLL